MIVASSKTIVIDDSKVANTLPEFPPEAAKYSLPRLHMSLPISSPADFISVGFRDLPPPGLFIHNINLHNFATQGARYITHYPSVHYHPIPVWVTRLWLTQSDSPKSRSQTHQSD